MNTVTSSLVRELPASFRLQHGAHPAFDAGACLMEAVAYVAGEPHTDRPGCTSPILAAIGRGLNDRFRDDERQLLAPLIPRLVGTRAPWEIERKRAFAMVDAAIRQIAPMGLDAAKWIDLAERMRAIAPIVDLPSADLARTACREIRAEARKRYDDAAYAAAYAAASAYADAADAAYAYADAADAAYAAAAAAAAAYADAADAAGGGDARRPIVEATIRAFERVIAIAA